MDTQTIVVVAVVALVVLGGIVILAASSRNQSRQAIGVMSRETKSRDKGSVKLSDTEGPTGKELELAAVVERKALAVPEAKLPVAWVPPDPDRLGATRRHVLNVGIIGGFGVGLSGFGAACIAFLWPTDKGGFGSVLNLGKVEELKAAIRAGAGFLYKPEGKLWVTEYPQASLEKARAAYSDAEYAGMEAGLVVLYQKCVHLGCRVPECKTSQWFECPCHGSQYNRVGEKRGGPAPRGLDRFAMSVADGFFLVDTGKSILGPPIGVNTTGQEAEGPHCTGGGH